MLYLCSKNNYSGRVTATKCMFSRWRLRPAQGTSAENNCMGKENRSEKQPWEGSQLSHDIYCERLRFFAEYKGSFACCSPLTCLDPREKRVPRITIWADRTGPKTKIGKGMNCLEVFYQIIEFSAEYEEVTLVARSIVRPIRQRRARTNDKHEPGASCNFVIPYHTSVSSCDWYLIIYTVCINFRKDLTNSLPPNIAIHVTTYCAH